MDLDAWEPTVDRNLWQRSGQLHIFTQPTRQGDGERVVAGAAPSMISITELTF